MESKHSLTSELKSLVFQPEFYYQGIEAMEAENIQLHRKGC